MEATHAKRDRLPGACHHDLRHHLASALIASCPVKTVQEALGHETATVTHDIWPSDTLRIRGAAEAAPGGR